MYEATITEVTQKNVKKKDGSPLTLFEISTEEGPVWTTGKRDLALDAQIRIGQRVLIDGKIEKNGNFTNHYLNGITDGDAIHSHPAIGPSTLDIPSKSQEIPMRQAPSGDAREASIHRQVAAKVSAQISDDADSFWSNLDYLVRYFETGEKPSTAASFSGSSVVDDSIPF